MNENREKWIIHRLVVGELMVNCYLVGCKKTRDIVVIDPGGEAELILDQIDKNDLHVTAIVNTHGHGDHIGANAELMEATGTPLLIGDKDAKMLPDAWKNLSAPFGMSIVSPPATRTLKEGNTIEIGERSLDVIETPGHSLGSVTLVGDGFAMVGDLIFAGSIGRTDLTGGNMSQLLKMIREKIFPLGDDYILYPGHGPETTVREEKSSNPFLQPGFTVW